MATDKGQDHQQQPLYPIVFIFPCIDISYNCLLLKTGKMSF